MWGSHTGWHKSGLASRLLTSKYGGQASLAETEESLGFVPYLTKPCGVVGVDSIIPSFQMRN